MKNLSLLISFLFIFVFITDFAQAQPVSSGDQYMQPEENIIDLFPPDSDADSSSQAPLRSAGNDFNEESDQSGSETEAETGGSVQPANDESSGQSVSGSDAANIEAEKQKGIGDTGGIVPCSGLDCNACSIVSLIERVVDWLIGVLLVVFAIVTAVAGFRLVISGGNTQAKTKAKELLTNAFIGIVIVLTAWLLIDTLMRALLPSGTGELTGYGPWSSLQCYSQVDSLSGNSFGNTSTGGGGMSVTEVSPDYVLSSEESDSCKLVVNPNDSTEANLICNTEGISLPSSSEQDAENILIGANCKPRQNYFRCTNLCDFYPSRDFWRCPGNVEPPVLTSKEVRRK